MQRAGAPLLGFVACPAVTVRRGVTPLYCCNTTQRLLNVKAFPIESSNRITPSVLHGSTMNDVLRRITSTAGCLYSYNLFLVSSLSTVRQMASGFSFFSSSGNKWLLQFWNATGLEKRLMPSAPTEVNRASVVAG